MKKAFRNTAVVTGCLLVPLILNRLYFKYRGGKSKPLFYDQYYSWRFGYIRYRVIGQGKPLLLIHGIYPGADMAEWKNADASLYQSYQIYTLDLLGFGHSEKPCLSYSAYLYTGLISDFIKDVIKRPAIVAASGYSAAYTVLGYTFEPRLYKKLLLISPAGIENGYELPTFKDHVHKWLLETPILGNSAYIYLISKKDVKLSRRLWRDCPDASYTKPIISATAFAGGPNAKLPIIALLCKFLNVKIKDKLNRIQIPLLILSKEYIGLQELPESLQFKSFLDI
ncbi:MAG: alpha/beta fold hydrolase [Clostridiales bacterium]|jgi:pimeloyl-ACP methyl ester carboxylesterase|nr:alpha/beta fold hydrolase [Clostridiales bacterium]